MLTVLLKQLKCYFLLRQGSIGFSEMEVQQIDSMISSFNAFESKDLGPLILAWAMFLCLVSSLPEKEENNLLMVHISVIQSMSYHYDACSSILGSIFLLNVLLLSGDGSH